MNAICTYTCQYYTCTYVYEFLNHVLSTRYNTDLCTHITIECKFMALIKIIFSSTIQLHAL